MQNASLQSITESASLVKLKQKKGLFIDFDDTIVDYDISANKALEDILKDQNIAPERFEFIKRDYEKINNSLWPKLEKGEMTIDQIRMKRFEILIANHALSGVPLKMDRDYLDAFVIHTKTDDMLHEKLVRIREKGLKISILTNGIKDVQHRRVERNGLLPLIDLLVTSEDIGKAKPAPDMFFHALDKLQLKKTEVLMIGDSLHSDIKGSQNAGIESVLVLNGRNFEDLRETALDCLPDYTSDSLNSFLDDFLNII
ncbi:MAG: noncanonical pyrimidine nucleotidase, YjjG family [Candidatus Heimdallarchaeota archaeon]|nr:noncanonical pyrimidine nucleotidase, YjjG family [Candidatus Heimdallarchaeota archaeon]